MRKRRDQSRGPAPSRRRERRAAERRTSRAGARRRLRLEQMESRQMFAGPQLAFIVPTGGTFLHVDPLLERAPKELTFRFDQGQQIDVNTLGGIRMFRAGPDDALGTQDDVIVDVAGGAGYAGLGDRPNEVLVRFGQNLPDDLYRITINGAGAQALRNIQGERFNNGQNQSIDFEIELGAQIIATVPQPVSGTGASRVQRDNQIDVYFNDDNLDSVSVVNPTFYQLIYVNNPADPLDDVTYFPQTVNYDSSLDKVELVFASSLDALGVGTYRLRVGNDDAPLPAPATLNVPADAVTNENSSFATAFDLSALQLGSTIVSSSIDAQPFTIPLPGGGDDPGHRNVPAEDHLIFGADVVGGVRQFNYNFLEDLGPRPEGGRYTNQITAEQKQRAREVLELYAYYLGVKFVETDAAGFTIATTDVRLVDPLSQGVEAGIAQPGAIAVMSSAVNWSGQEQFGGSWFQVAMHEIGHVIGLGHTYDLPAMTIMGDDGGQTPAGTSAEAVYPGDNDILHGQHIYRPDVKDIDLYRFTLSADGTFTANVTAERLATPSMLDSVITVYDANFNVVARNDDFWSEDSYLELKLAAGEYFIGVTASGNNEYDPRIQDSGFGGKSQGAYELQLGFRPAPQNSLVDATGTLFDGDLDGQPGGEFNYWFNVSSNTIWVDKTADLLGPGSVGSITNPYNNLAIALSAAQPGDIVRVLGNAGTDGKLNTPEDNVAYEIGYGVDAFGNLFGLSDGESLQVPQGVTLVIGSGAVLKLSQTNITVGSSEVGVDQSGGALQVLGNPFAPVIFTSYNDESIGGDTNPLEQSPSAGDWGGIVFRNDMDLDEGRIVLEKLGHFVNYVNHADIRYGGGQLSAGAAGSLEETITPLHLIEARPTLTFNTITDSRQAAISADPDSFEHSKFDTLTYTADYERAGPEIFGNQLTALRIDGNVHTNSLNGLFVRIETPEVINRLNVAARFDDTDIIHLLTENLLINGSTGNRQQDRILLRSGTPGGPVVVNGQLQARLDARLLINPDVVVKLDSSRIEVGIGTQLIAEGQAGHPVIFTSLQDDRYGAGGTFDTNGDDLSPAGEDGPRAGDWAGLYFSPASAGSLDHVQLNFAGGDSSIEGGFANFNPVEIHQADVRIANSLFELNAGGLDGSNRAGRGANSSSTVFVLGAQPVIVNNTFVDNLGATLSVNANSLVDRVVSDPGRSTGPAEVFTQLYDNFGPLIRLNRIGNTPGVEGVINGLEVRPGVLTTRSVWDDTDIVHVVQGEIAVSNVHSQGGLRLQSSATESLVVKLLGDTAGFTATGVPLDIDDRIGGSVQIIGTPGRPVVLTSLTDCSVGAGFTPDGQPQFDTDNHGLCTEETVTTLPPYADVIVVMDESGSMGGAQQFSIGLIASLDTALAAAGVGDGTPGNNRYGLVGYGGGGSINSGHAIPVGAGGALFGSSTEYAAAAGQLVLSGAAEDGYEGINFALNTYSFRSDATKFIILVTDEPRDEQDPSLTFATTLAALNAAGVSLQVIITGDHEDGAGTTALAVDANGVAYLEAPNAGITTSPGGVVRPSFSFDTTVADYVDMAFATGGISGDIGQISQGGNTAASFASALITGIVGQVAAVNPAAPGQWRSIQLDQFSNDRNVAVIAELEDGYTGGTDVNKRPQDAQYLGRLAAHEKAGDDLQRLGFEVHGTIAFDAPSDLDVYSFRATAGTEVWLDIDRSAMALDSIVELLSASGQVLARSNDSFAESENPNLLNGLLANNLGRTMQRDDFLGKDHFSTNPRDAGMRVILPGAGNSLNTYYVRVRSLGQNINALTGQTSGAYQLQVRLRELDEFPGSTVQFADIRYATNGIEVLGLPAHSPLLGEAGDNETTVSANEGSGAAQPLGNLLQQDRNAISVAGQIAGATDVDWFSFTVDYELIQQAARSGLTWATVFDIDYSDGLLRGDLTLSVFDAAGRLILVARDSDIVDDVPGPLEGDDADDLTRGSFGTLDPFIGTVQLPEGQNQQYFVAISSDRLLPSSLDQFVNANATNPLIRLEPVNSVARIVEDRIGAQGGTTAAPATGPTALFTGTTATQLNTYATPFTLSDVTLFVSTNSGAGQLFTVDPYSGVLETTIGALPGRTVNGFNLGYQDIAMRNDGRLYALTIGTDNSESGNYRQISTENASVLSDSDDDIETYRLGANGPEATDVGVQFEAWTYLQNSFSTFRTLYAVGNISDPFVQNALYILDPNTGVGQVKLQDPAVPSNALPIGIIDTGQQGVGLITTAGTAANLDDGDTFTVDGGTGPATFEIDLGVTIRINGGGGGIADGATFSITDGPDVVNYYFALQGGIVPPATGFEIITYTAAMSAQTIRDLIISAVNNPQNPNLPVLSGLQAVAHGANGVYLEDQNLAAQHSVNVSSIPIFALDGIPGVQNAGIGIQITPFYTAEQVAAATAAVIDATMSSVLRATVANDTVSLLGPAVTVNTNDTPFTQFNLGNFSGGRVTGLAAIGANLFGVTENGVFLRMSLTGQVLQSVVLGDQFTSLTAGPLNVQNGAFANLLFATTAQGRLMCLDGNGNLQAIFTGGATSVQMGVNGVPVGLAFSNIDYNLWHVTERQSNAAGHGINSAIDNSRDPVAGDQSFYFGLDTDTAAQPGLIPYDTNPTERGTYNVPGGAYGSLSTNAFSLQGYQASDKPTLYFNYFLETEDRNSTLNNHLVRDSFRVFITTDGGATWTMMATNNSVQTQDRSESELPEVLTVSDVQNYTGDPRQMNQPLFDNTGAWRQARVDLSRFAGQANIQFRFDFSTSGVIYDPNGPNFTAPMLGDAFGDFFSVERNQRNTGQGAYIDDIVVGFAERGEMATGATANTGFFALPTIPANLQAQRLTGPYQLEIRRGAEYAAQDPPDPPDIGLVRVFDTNDRLNQSFTLLAPAGANVTEGQTFSISDGNLTVVFEFSIDATLATPGATRVAYAGGMTAVQVAQSIVTAVNGHATLRVNASAIATSNRVNLFGARFVDVGGVLSPGGTVVVSEVNDTLVDATLTGLASNAPGIYQGSGLVGDNPNLASNPTSDVDIFRVQLNAGDRMTIDIDAAINGSTLDSRLRVFNAAGAQLAQSDDNAAPGEGGSLDSYLDFIAPLTGTYYIGVSGYNNNGYDPLVEGSGAGTYSTGPYTIHIQVGAFSSLEVERFDFRGDSNRVRDAGQTLISNNRIANVSQFGIVVDAAARDAGGSRPYPGAPINTPNLNNQRLVPGVTVQNNILEAGRQGGIRFSGDPNAAGQPLAAVSFGRIVNNTIYGGGAPAGIGIQITENAGPTILNNVLSNLAVGVQVDGSSSVNTRLGYSIYQGNTTNTTGIGLGTSSPILAAGAPLFTNAAESNFYPAAGSRTIDASLDSLQDRLEMVSVIDSLGIAQSPIVSPERDIYNLLRVDDTTVAPPPGQGSSVFKDRGAVERADFVGPRANLILPFDGDGDSIATLLDATVYQFAVQLSDGAGVGVDDSTVGGTSARVYRNGRLLAQGVDYVFAYDSTNDILLFTADTLFFNGNVYHVVLDPSIKDRAGNSVQQNQGVNAYKFGNPQFTINLDSTGNDAPAVGVPGLQTMAEDTSLLFNTSAQNAISIFDVDAGNQLLLVTLTTTTGTLTLGGTANLIGLTGDGSGTISFAASALNATIALNGLKFTPPANYNGPATINVSVDDQGATGGPAQVGTGAVQINVASVIDSPVVNPANPSVTFNEDSPAVVVNLLNFFSDADAINGDSLTFLLLSNSNPNLVTAALSANTANLNLTFAANQNGFADLLIRATDTTGLSIQATLRVNVTAINDVPTVLNPLPDLTVDEDSADRTISLVNVFRDPDIATNGDVLTYSVTGNNALLVQPSIVSGNQLFLDFAPNRFGTATITVRATDQTGAFVEDVFTITVRNIPEAPVAVDDEYDFNVNTPLTVAAAGLLSNDSDPDGDPLTAVLFDVPVHGKVVVNSDGSFTYQPDPGYAGDDLFRYAADDGQFRTIATVRLRGQGYVGTQDSRFVQSVYWKLLGRAPAQSEIDSWLAQLPTVGRASMAASVLASPERRGTVIRQLYQDYLLREADADGVNFWLGVWARQGQEYVQAGIIGSAEFYQSAGGTDRAWVLALYQRLLGRPANQVTEGEIAFYLDRIQRVTRADIVLGFVLSDEYRLGLITGYYNDCLGRNPEAGGAQFWLNEIKSRRATLEGIQAGIIGSNEYYGRV